jgi:hypothetical protein
LEGAYYPPCGCCSQRVREEKAAVRAEQMGYADGAAAGGEDRKPKGAFGEVEDHRRESGDRTKGHADQDNRKVLEGNGDRCEGQRERDVSTGGNEASGADDEKSLAGEGFLKRSDAVC